MDFRVLALAVGNFVTACSAIVVVGLLNEIAADMQVSVAVAGLLSAAFAATSAVLAPVVGILGSHVPRRTVLVAAIAINALGSLGSALAPTFGVLMGFRMLVGSSIGAYIPAAVTTAGMIAPPDQRGRAIFMITMGASIAQVFGVPLGVWFGGISGWRNTLLIFSLLGAIVCVTQIRIIPNHLRAVPFNMQSWGELRRHRPILMTLLVSALQSTGSMMSMTYLAPQLRDSLQATPNTISLLLGIFGLAGLVGSFIGIRNLDRVGPQRISIFALGMMAANFALWQFAHGSFVLTALAMCLWGVGFIMIGTAQQTRLVLISPKLAPVSVAFNTSCVFGGSAIGATLGSATIAFADLRALTGMSLGIILAALAIQIMSPPPVAHSASHAR